MGAGRVPSDWNRLVTLSRLPTRCKACKAKFSDEDRALHRRIHPDCIPAYAEAQQAKAQRKAEKLARMAAKVDRALDRAKRRELEPIGKLEKRSEAAVNAYVRARDHSRRLGCISCDKPWDWDGQWHASHFRSVGAASSVRYHLWNINRACWICNKLYSGRIDAYGPALVDRIGQEKVDWLKAQNQPVRRTREYLERLRAVFAKKLRRLEKRMA